MRHRRFGVELRGLQEGPLGFARPERMHLRYALIEELLRFRTLRRDREMDGSLPFEQFRRQGGGALPGGGTQASAGFGGLRVGWRKPQPRTEERMSSFIGPPNDGGSSRPVDPSDTTTFYHGQQFAVTADHRGPGSVDDRAFLRPIHEAPIGSGLRTASGRTRQETPLILAGTPEFSIGRQYLGACPIADRS